MELVASSSSAMNSSSLNPSKKRGFETLALGSIQQRVVSSDDAEGKLVQLQEDYDKLLELQRWTNNKYLEIYKENQKNKDRIEELETFLSNVSKQIANELMQIAARLQQLPHVFASVASWSAYSDQIALEQIRTWAGSSILLDLLSDVFDECNQAISRKNDLSTSREHKIVTIFVTILEAIMPQGSCQFVPSWVMSLIIKGLTHSSLAVDILGKLVVGAPNSDVQLSNILKDATVNANEKAESTELGENQKNLTFTFDNAPCSIASAVFNKVITLLSVSSYTDTKLPANEQFVQGLLSADDPRLWQLKYDSVLPVLR